MMAPVGSLALIDPAGALPVANACARRNSLMIYSTFADPPLETVRAKVNHPIILGLYVRGDETWLDRTVDEAKAAGCLAIAVVTEAPYYSRRERDFFNNFRSRGSKSGTYADTQKMLREGGACRSDGGSRCPHGHCPTKLADNRSHSRPLRAADHPQGHRDLHKMRGRQSNTV